MGIPRVLSKSLWTAPVLALLSFAPAASAQGVAQTPQELGYRQLSPRATGQVQTPSNIEELANPIVAPETFSDGDEERPVPDPLAAAAPPAQSLPAEVLALDSNMAARVNDVLACRLEIAADRRVPVRQVKASSVLLRWTVTPGGNVDGAEVVATRSTDPDVLSCARRKIEAWVFVRAPGGEPLSIQQPLRFE